jgi:negative regulator of genetic competence, sporulation and motility
MMNHEMHSSKLENRTLSNHRSGLTKKPSIFSCLYKFRDIEDLILLSHRLPLPFFDTKMIRYKEHYYLAVLYPEQRVMRHHEWVESIILEYGERTQATIHRLEEYGNTIVDENAVATIRTYFRRLTVPTS